MTDRPAAPAAHDGDHDGVHNHHPDGWDRYGVALLLLLGSVLVFAVMEDARFGRTILLTTQGAALLALFRASQVRQRTMVATTAVVVLAVLGSAVGAAAIGERALWPSAAVGGLLVLAAPLAIMRRLRDQPRIDVSTVLGALCLYVLGGLAFAYAYLVMGDLGGTPFFAQLEAARPIDFVYFSFVTLATLGYGDLTPAGDVGRMLAVTETVLGQLYLVAVVATLVSNLGRVRARGPVRR